jgi:hypothetical protein
MPLPYGMRGGWRATFTGGVLEYSISAGFTGQGPATLTEHTEDGERPIELADTSPCEAMIDWPALPARQAAALTRPAPSSHSKSPSRSTSDSPGQRASIT